MHTRKKWELQSVRFVNQNEKIISVTQGLYENRFCWTNRVPQWRLHSTGSGKVWPVYSDKHVVEYLISIIKLPTFHSPHHTMELQIRKCGIHTSSYNSNTQTHEGQKCWLSSAYDLDSRPYFTAVPDIFSNLRLMPHTHAHARTHTHTHVCTHARTHAQQTTNSATFSTSLSYFNFHSSLYLSYGGAQWRSG
jgi:hypothetical protein